MINQDKSLKLTMSGAPGASTYGNGSKRGAMHGRTYGGGVKDNGEDMGYPGSDAPPEEFGKFDLLLANMTVLVSK